MQTLASWLSTLSEFPQTLTNYFKSGLSSDKLFIRKSHVSCLLHGANGFLFFF